MKDLIIRLKKFKHVEGDCWRWLGSVGMHGGGRPHIKLNGRMVNVARLSLHIYKGFDLDSTLQALHIRECPNKDCWNPEHLYAGTEEQNMQDKRDASTHCQRGHEYSLTNMKTDYRGARVCITCYNQRESIQKTAENRKKNRLRTQLCRQRKRAAVAANTEG